MAALLFALVLMDVINIISELGPDLDVNAWYLHTMHLHQSQIYVDDGD